MRQPLHASRGCSSIFQIKLTLWWKIGSAFWSEWNPPNFTYLLARAKPCSSVWRSISTPVQDCPLALCDFRTVRSEDLVPADIIFPHYQDEAYEVLYNPNHRWFYKKGMEWDDVLLFKLGDNSPDEAPCKLVLHLTSDCPMVFIRCLMDPVCPHSAFMDPSVPKGTPSRVSIEVRAIIIGWSIW